MRGGLRVLSSLSTDGAAAVAERLFLSPRKHVRPEREQELLARGRRIHLTTPEGELAAWEWGAPAPAPCVLLVHGWEGRGAQLGELVDPLVALDFRVVAFDAPAHGDSAGERGSLFHVAEAVMSARQQLGPLHAIVSHSMGGAGVLWACRDGALASRFVLIAPPLDLRDFTRSLSRMLGLSEEVRERVHQRLEARFGVSIERVQAEGLAAKMRAPALIVHDEDDREVPVACGEAIARAWPGAELVRTHGLGHQRILRDAGARDAAVRFVAQSASS